MRSTLIKRHHRGCPQCGHVGFAKTGVDFFGAATFECNACRHEWSSERGSQKGTSRDRINETPDY